MGLSLQKYILGEDENAAMERVFEQANKPVFIKRDNNSFLIKMGEKITLVECQEVDEVINIGNAIIEGRDLSKFNKNYVQEIAEFIKENIQSDSPMPFPFIYSNIQLNDINHTSDINTFIMYRGSKIALLLNSSINDYRSMTKALMKSSTPFIAIVYLDGKYLISQVLDDNSGSTCLLCMLNRWIESHREVYQYRSLYEYKHTCNIDKVLHMLIEKATYKLYKENRNVVYVIDANHFETNKYLIVKKEGCSTCNNVTLKTDEINIRDSLIDVENNGSRLYHPKTIIAQLEPYIGFFGPIIKIVENGHEDKINFPVFQSYMASNPLEKSCILHGGKGSDYYQAKMSAIAEAIERYNARQHGNEQLLYESYEILSKSHYALNPESLCLDKDYPYEYNHSKKIEWVQGINLGKNRREYVPANAVFFIYHPTVEKEAQFIPQDTTGLASGGTIEEAIYQGLCEVIERDSYAIYYRQNLPCSTIDLSDISDSRMIYLVHELEKKNICLHLKYLKNDTDVIVVHAVLEDKDGNYPIYTHGAGASLHPVIAAQRAITEAIQLRVSQSVIKKFSTQEEFITSKNPYITWGRGESSEFSNLLHSPEDDVISLLDITNHSTKNLKENIYKIVNNLSKMNYSVYVVNLSRTDNPIYTVRVIVPGFQSTDDTMRRITDRMFQLPNKLGLPHSRTIDGLRTTTFFA